MPLTLEQHAFRRQGIGASEIAAVVGLNKWSRPIDVWQSKVGITQPHPPTPATERGDFLEPALREWYAYRFDRQVTLSDTLRHKDHDIALATPDGISSHVDGSGDPVLLEIKSPGRNTQYDWGDDGTDEVPLYYLPQVTWAMAVAGLAHAHVVALVHGDLRCYNVPFDQELFDELLMHGKEFWQKYVVKNKPPPVDDSKQYADYLARKFARAAEDIEPVCTKQIAEDIGILVRAEERLITAQAQVEKAKNTIKSILNTRSHARSDLGTVTWKNNKDTAKTDWKAVAMDLGASPAAIAARTTVVPGPRVFRFIPTKKTKGA